MNETTQSTVGDVFLAAIAAEYRFSIVSSTVLRDASDNAVYLVETPDCRYVARVSKRISDTAEGVENIEFELELITHLAKGGLQVPAIVPTPDGKLYSSIRSEDANAMVVLFGFMEGISFPLTPENKLPLSMARKVGECLGRYHTLVRDFAPRHTKSRNLFTELDRLLERSSFIEKTFANGAEVTRKANLTKKFLQSNDVPPIVIHNDVRPHNIFWNPTNTEITGLLDFDWACMGDYRKDIAHTALEWAQPDGLQEPWMDVFDAVVDGYSTTSHYAVPDTTALARWVETAAFLDACTYWVDRLDQFAASGDAVPSLKSYMYGKSEYWSARHP